MFDILDCRKETDSEPHTSSESIGFPDRTTRPTGSQILRVRFVLSHFAAASELHANRFVKYKKWPSRTIKLPLLFSSTCAALVFVLSSN